MAESTCKACGTEFKFRPEFYSSRGLKPPRRCEACRAERRYHLAERMTGRVVSTGPKFSVLEADGTGERCVAPPMPLGALVGWEVRELPASGRWRQAFDVREE